jgi:betaine-aldehyde dehydrogenase
MVTSEARNIIGGEYRPGGSGNEVKRYCPATGGVLGSFISSTSEDVHDAIRSAREAFENTHWSRDPKLRVHVLRELHNAIVNNFDHIAKIQTSENGKIIRDSRAELQSAADLFDFYSGLVRGLYGRTNLPDVNTMSFVLREPIGVVGIIAPWNAPIVLLARSLAPALAAGNTVVIKPASFTPITIYEFLDKMLQNVKDLPKGVINLVIGSGETVGSELVKHEDVDFISFTGSTEAGALVMREASVNIKRLSLELGGKTPNIILDDADIESAVTGAIRGSMLGSAGQICFAGTRVLVHENVYDDVRDRIIGLVPQLKVGNGMNEDVDVGPVVSEGQLKRVLYYIEEGEKVSKLLVGGNRLTDGEYSKGHFVEPTIFGEVPADALIAREEIFGPVVSLLRVKSIDEIPRIANDTKYGLSAAIWTKDINKALKLARDVKAGIVWINTYGKMLPDIETGVYKQSGIGGALRGVEAMNTFTEIKNVLVNVE